MEGQSSVTKDKDEDTSARGSKRHSTECHVITYVSPYKGDLTSLQRHGIDSDIGPSPSKIPNIMTSSQPISEVQRDTHLENKVGHDSKSSSTQESNSTINVFNKIKVLLASQLTRDDMWKLSMLLNFPRGEWDRIKQSENLSEEMIDTLEKRSIISPTDNSQLIKELDEIHRKDIIASIMDLSPESATVLERKLNDFEVKKRSFIEELKVHYQLQCKALKPVPYFGDTYSIEQLFVECGVEIETSNGNRGGKKYWTPLQSYHDILSHMNNGTKRIVIKGEAGYGKSTLMLQFLYEWSLVPTKTQPTPLKDFEILIFLRLRQLSGMTSIYQGIRQLLLPQDSDITVDDIKEIIKKTKSVLLLLDGYDEYPEKSNSDTDINRIAVMKMLQYVNAIITSRSVRILPDEARSYSTRFRLTGFGVKERYRYIGKAFKGTEDEYVEKLIRPIKDNLVLDELCKNPLFFVMSVHIAQDERDFQIYKSVTRFFQFLIACFHSHMEGKMKEADPMVETFRASHGELDKVAFEGLSNRNQQIEWEAKTLEKRIGMELYQRYVQIGILIEEKTIKNAETCSDPFIIKEIVMVRFHHKMFCEFYAAHFLSSRAIMDDIERILQSLDPYDLQYVYRFACGLNPVVGSKIIDHLRSRSDGTKFAMLCFLEQAEHVDMIKETVRKLCSERILIRHDYSKLIQRSTIQLLTIASKYDITITNLNLAWCLSEFKNGNLILQSGLAIPSLPTVARISISSNELSTKDVANILSYGQQSKRFKELWFLNCQPPTSFGARFIPEDLKVVWPSNASFLDSESGQWKQVGADDIESIRILCSDAVFIKNNSPVSVQKSTVELLTNACRHDIPIYLVVLSESFKKAEGDAITLVSNIALPTLSSAEKLWICTEKGRHLTKAEVVDILTYVQLCKRCNYFGFYWCFVPSTIELRDNLCELVAQNTAVVWFPFGPSGIQYRLHRETGHWLLSNGSELSEEDYLRQSQTFQETWSCNPS